MGPALDKPVLLIDGDILAYRAASATDGRQYEVKHSMNLRGTKVTVTTIEKYKKDADRRKEELGDAFVSLEQVWHPEPDTHAFKLIKDSLISLERNLEGRVGELGRRRIFLSRGGSFREVESPTYKRNREDMRRPANLEASKDYLMKHHGAIVMPGVYEADDLLAMNADENSIICSIDKDLLQVPGYHYNFVKDTFIYVDATTGWRNFYSQLLTGDTSDGIVGIHGIGPVTAGKILSGLQTPFLMYCAVLKQYLHSVKREEGEEDSDFYARVTSIVHHNAHLLYLLRHPQERWEEPTWE